MNLFSGRSGSRTCKTQSKVVAQETSHFQDRFSEDVFSESLIFRLESALQEVVVRQRLRVVQPHHRCEPVFRRNPLGPVDPSFRALFGHLEFTVRRQKFDKILLFPDVQAERPTRRRAGRGRVGRMHV